MARLVGLLLLGACASGCILPLMTGTPHSATTVGKSQFGVTGWAEWPGVNLAASNRGSGGTSLNPFPGGVLQGALGVRDDLDVELGVEGMLYLFFLPLPTGLRAGPRWQFLDTEHFAGAAAAHVGYANFTVSSAASSTTTLRTSISALNFGATATLQFVGIPVFNPSIALGVFPSHVWYSNTRSGLLLPIEETTFSTVTASATGNLAFDFGSFELTLFGGVAAFFSPKLSAVEAIPQGGLAMAFRADKRERRRREEQRALEAASPQPAFYKPDPVPETRPDGLPPIPVAPPLPGGPPPMPPPDGPPPTPPPEPPPPGPPPPPPPV